MSFHPIASEDSGPPLYLHHHLSSPFSKHTCYRPSSTEDGLKLDIPSNNDSTRDYYDDYILIFGYQ